MQPYEQLEHDWAAFNGLAPAGMVACASGTAALHLSLEAMRLPPGSEVVTGDYNMIAVPRAIAMAGLTPVFVDCGPDLNMDPEIVERCYPYPNAHMDGVPMPEAIVVTHVYGRRADVDLIHGQKIGQPVVEDLAEAHGVRPHPATDAACWSFYRNKIVAGEEGGAVWFRDPEHAKLAKQLRSLGFTDAHDYRHVPRGHNYRMSNAHAGLILNSLKRSGFPLKTPGLPDGLTGGEQRRLIEGWYDAACPAEWRMPARAAVWVYDVRVPGLRRESQADVVKSLNAAGVAARMGFWPMHAQEEFDRCRFVHRDLAFGGPQSGRAANEVFYLPVQPGVTTKADCRRAFQIIRASLPPAP